MLYRLIVAAVLLAAIGLMSGCGGGCPRTADPASGDFYTEEEYQKCSKEQREFYCQQLLDEYRLSQDCVDSAKADLSKEQMAIADLEGELAGMEPRLMSLRAEVQGLESEAPSRLPRS